MSTNLSTFLSTGGSRVDRWPSSGGQSLELNFAGLRVGLEEGQEPVALFGHVVKTWAARGMVDDQVAKVLGTSPTTVGKHLEHACANLGVHSRAEALALLMLSAPRN